MTDKKKFIIGSRGSKLSLAYSSHVKNLLIKSDSKFDDNSIEIKVIKTSGDIFQNKRISDILLFGNISPEVLIIFISIEFSLSCKFDFNNKFFT